MTQVRAPVRAVSFDYWDTLYNGAAIPGRILDRQASLWSMLQTLGAPVAQEHFVDAYTASGREADRWWREEQRGYTSEERIRWMLDRLQITRPADCEHVRAACQAVDDAFVRFPPPILDGAAEMLRGVRTRVPVAILSDTGFASGRAQDSLLVRDGIRDLFAATIYSMDVGHAKPHAKTFSTVAAALHVAPESIIHIGDNERTDMLGALAFGMRAVRVDIVRQGVRPSAAEFVATSFAELSDYLSSQL